MRWHYFLRRMMVDVVIKPQSEERSLSIVNRCGISLEDAFRAKEAKNETRIWV